MEFRNEDPGASQYGNFINYYRFNDAEERLRLLPKNVWTTDDNSENTNEPYLVLDVGCNAGVLTQLLQTHLAECVPNRAVHILGVDIDGLLIQRAVEANQLPEFVTYAQVDVMDDEQCKQFQLFLGQHNRIKFDAICCFSITMWIHLNHHDTGLQQFLNKLCKIAELFVVEPQPWKCYQRAQHRLKKTGENFPLFLDLQWRSDVDEQIQNYIEQKLCRLRVFESSPTKWRRKICFYR